MFKQLKLLYLIYICEGMCVKLAQHCLNRFDKCIDKNTIAAHIYALAVNKYIRKGEVYADRIEEMLRED